VSTKRSATGATFLVSILLIALVIACGGDDKQDQPSPTAGSPGATQEPDGARTGILSQVQSRGELICGVNDAVPGFGILQPDGSFAGFDVDFCRAVAVAVLGDPEAVQFVPLTAEARLTALQTGQVDVLIRNTTWTVGRDAQSGLSFATVNFYDGQGMMVRADSGFTSVDDLATATICVLQGTTTELNLADRLPDSTALGFENNDTLQQAFIEGRCDGWTSDKSQLAARRFAFPEAAGGSEALVILEETFSKEPLAPVTIDNDSQWFDVVNWTVIGTILAEELGITSQNVDDMAANPPSLDVARLLGVPFEGGEVFNPGLGLDPDFMQEVIRSAGNYGEIYDRNITPIGIAPRPGTLNALWTDGGLIYAPPWR
jgi:general L-amino acid transport system substrate-binding protein